MSMLLLHLHFTNCTFTYCTLHIAHFTFSFFTYTSYQEELPQTILLVGSVYVYLNVLCLFIVDVCAHFMCECVGVCLCVCARACVYLVQIAHLVSGETQFQSSV